MDTAKETFLIIITMIDTNTWLCGIAIHNLRNYMNIRK